MEPLSTTSQSEAATISRLAKQTRTSVEVVRRLYEEQIAVLRREASVKRFIGVIAARRVKQRLRARVSRSAAHQTTKQPSH